MQQRNKVWTFFFIFVCLRCLIWSAHGLRFSFVWDSLLISDYTVLPVSVCFITVRRKVNAIKWKIPITATKTTTTTAATTQIDKRNLRKRISNPIKKETCNIFSIATKNSFSIDKTTAIHAWEWISFSSSMHCGNYSI